MSCLGHLTRFFWDAPQFLDHLNWDSFLLPAFQLGFLSVYLSVGGLKRSTQHLGVCFEAFARR